MEALDVRVTATVNSLHVEVVLKVTEGAAVRLGGLSNAKFNGLLGVVEGAAKDSRFPVRISTGVISVKEGNLQLERAESVPPCTCLVGLNLADADTDEVDLFLCEIVAGRGEHTFPFILPGSEGMVVVRFPDPPHAALATTTTATLRYPAGASPRLAKMLRRVPPEELITFLDPSHKLGEWLMDCEGDWFWILDQSYEFWVRLYQHALFTLPSEGTPVVSVINPEQRYCVDLTCNVRWDKSKKLRRHRGKFFMSINRDFKQSIELAREYHLDFHESTWMTDSLVATLVRMTADTACAVQGAAFELWDRPDPESAPRLCAVVLGFGCGSAWHDYTMATLVRDDRSSGALLTKAVGHLLHACGYKIWCESNTPRSASAQDQP
jgi:hypothetical protein